MIRYVIAFMQFFMEFIENCNMYIKQIAFKLGYAIHSLEETINADFHLNTNMDWRETSLYDELFCPMYVNCINSLANLLVDNVSDIRIAL